MEEKVSGMDAELLRQFKEIQLENMELKRMYADLSLDHSLLKKGIVRAWVIDLDPPSSVATWRSR